MINYQWSVSPGGTIVSGINQSKVTVNWHGTGTQYVYCNYTSPYGCPITQSTFKVAVWNLPIPTITGEEIVNLGSTWRYTTEPGMNSYVWNVSSGGFISGGGGSSSYYADITWEGTGQQFVSVNYSSSYGCSAAAPTIYNVTVNPPVLSPGTGPGLVTKEIEITSGLNTTSNRAEIADISIYPVPNDGRFTIAVTSRKAENYSITIYNYLGTKVYDLKNLEINGPYKRDIDLGTVAEGIYMVMIRTAESQAVRRIFIKK
jgi:hypothetical protein